MRRMQVNDISDVERLKFARLRTTKIVDHLTPQFEINASNNIAIYSDKLASQIPPSFAGYAFIQFKMSMHYFAVVRLAAIWDAFARDRESIPTIVRLISKPEIISKVADEAYNRQLTMSVPPDLTPSTDPKEIKIRNKIWESRKLRRAKDERQKVCSMLKQVISAANKIEQSDLVIGMRRFRNEFIAHNLDILDSDLSTKSKPKTFLFGDEETLLDQTVPIVDILYLGLNGIRFPWDQSKVMAKRNAEQLWNNCNFSIE